MSAKSRYRKSRFASAVMRAVNRHSEVKEVMRPMVANKPLYHNTVQNINPNAFYCDIGFHGGNGDQNHAQRIGNKIFVKGIKVSLMLENQQYRPLCSYWIYLVRLKEGRMSETVNSKDQLFEGVSTTIPMDYIDTSKCDILYRKKFTVRMPNAGTSSIMNTTVPGAADKIHDGADWTVFTNPQKITKFYVPINKTIMFRDSDDSGQRVLPSSYLYQWAVACYDNYSATTNDTTYPLGHLTMTTIMKFTDV